MKRHHTHYEQHANTTIYATRTPATTKLSNAKTKCDRRTIISIQASIWTPSRHWKHNNSTTTIRVRQATNTIRKIKTRIWTQAWAEHTFQKDPKHWCCFEKQNIEQKSQGHVIRMNPAEAATCHITSMPNVPLSHKFPKSKNSQTKTNYFILPNTWCKSGAPTQSRLPIEKKTRCFIVK